MTEEEREALIGVLTGATTAALCETYVKLRDAKKAAEDALAQKLTGTKVAMEAVESILLARLDEQNITTVVTPFGTAYKTTRAGYTVQDRSEFLNWALQEEVTHALDIRAAKAAVDEIVETTGELPPGLSRHAIFKIGIRRSPNQ